MSDAYAHTNPQVRARVAALLRGWDRQLLHAVASRHWPGAEPVLPRLSRSANHGLLWFGAAAGMVALGRGTRSRRAAVRGVASLALASATINTVGKRSVRRARPVLDAVPVIRRLKRQPRSWHWQMRRWVGEGVAAGVPGQVCQGRGPGGCCLQGLAAG
jgi:hypothetical protein